MDDIVARLVRHFEEIYTEHMRDLPIVNPRVHVEAVGFRDFEGERLGVLITPWFMNLVLLPRSDRWSGSAPGETSSIEYPSGPIEFTVAHDQSLGTYLSAVLFRTVTDMPDQDTARKIAEQVMQDLFKPPRQERSLSRRELLTGLRGA